MDAGTELIFHQETEGEGKDEQIAEGATYVEHRGAKDEGGTQMLDFLIEKGAFHLRVNQLEEAVEVLNKVISIDGKYAAAYRMLGYCQALQKKNKEACKNFAIAKELGDEVVDTLIEKYCK